MHSLRCLALALAALVVVAPQRGWAQVEWTARAGIANAFPRGKRSVAVDDGREFSVGLQAGHPNSIWSFGVEVGRARFPSTVWVPPGGPIVRPHPTYTWGILTGELAAPFRAIAPLARVGVGFAKPPLDEQGSKAFLSTSVGLRTSLKRMSVDITGSRRALQERDTHIAAGAAVGYRW